MNELKHHKLTIDYWTWEPMQKAADRDLDDLVSKIRIKELLSHCGNVHTVFEEIENKV